MLVSNFAFASEIKKTLTKQEHINYWTETARRDWIAVKQLFKGKSYVNALFFSHLVLEKLLKAHWVKDNKENHPPKIHNLISLAGRISFSFSDDEKIFLSRMNDFQLEGRYPDYSRNVYRSYKQKETQSILREADRIRKCLLKKLQ